MRTNFAEMPGNRIEPGSRDRKSSVFFYAEDQERRGGESESLEEEDIEIGNS
jgi:hypothetical protein